MLGDYWQAMRCGARGRGLAAARVPVEVLLARFRFGLGPRWYSMQRLWRHPVREWADYVDDHRNKPWLQSINPDGPRRLLDDKLEFHRHCRAHELPTVPVLGVVAVRAGTGDDPPAVDSTAALAGLLSRHPAGLFIKPRDGSHGEGAFTVLPAADGARWLGRVTDLATLLEYCRSQAEAHSMLVVQPRVRPAHPLGAIMSAHGLGTVRAVTWLEGDRPRLLVACLRIPVGERDADNFLHGASGNLVAAIDPANGRLTRVLGSRRRDWPDIVEFERHPDTGRRIAGFVLPQWSALLDLVTAAQRVFPGLPSIGWDVAITEQGPLLIEGNGRYDVDILQLAHDRGLRSALRAALEGGASHASTPA